MSEPEPPRIEDPFEATIKVSDETTERVLQNFRNRIEELSSANARLRFTLESIKASAQRELRRHAK